MLGKFRVFITVLGAAIALTACHSGYYRSTVVYQDDPYYADRYWPQDRYDYHYYPDVNVYFHVSTGFYFYRDHHHKWHKVHRLPVHIHLNHHNRQHLHIKHEKPYREHSPHHRPHEYQRPNKYHRPEKPGGANGHKPDKHKKPRDLKGHKPQREHKRLPVKQTNKQSRNTRELRNQRTERIKSLKMNRKISRPEDLKPHQFNNVRSYGIERKQDLSKQRYNEKLRRPAYLAEKRNYNRIEKSRKEHGNKMQRTYTRRDSR